MSTTHVVLLLVAGLSCFPAFAQSGGVVAGQTAGMQVQYPSNLFFQTNNQPPYASQELDVDGDGTSDFQLYHEVSSAISIALLPLSPNEWQVLNTSASNALYRPLSVPVPSGSRIDASVPDAAWGSRGQLRFITANAGISTASGAWQEDTVSRYIGIRQLQNNRWRYGYLKTKRLVANWAPAPVFVTAYALQGLVTGTAQAQWPQVAVYPNPAQALLQLTCPQQGRLRVYTAVGGLQHEQPMAAGGTQLSVSNWKAGFYVLQLVNEQDVYSTHFQKTD